MSPQVKSRRANGILAAIIAIGSAVVIIILLWVMATVFVPQTQFASATTNHSGYYQLKFDKTGHIVDVIDDVDRDQPDAYPYFQWGYNPESGSFIVGQPPGDLPGFDAYLELKGSIVIDGASQEVVDKFEVAIDVDDAVSYYNDRIDEGAVIYIEKWYGLQFAVMYDARDRIAAAQETGFVPTPAYVVEGEPTIRTDERAVELYQGLLVEIKLAGAQKAATDEYCSLYPSIKWQVTGFCEFDAEQTLQDELDGNFGFDCAYYKLALTNRKDVLASLKSITGGNFTYSIGKTTMLGLATALPCAVSTDYHMIQTAPHGNSPCTPSNCSSSDGQKDDRDTGGAPE